MVRATSEQLPWHFEGEKAGWGVSPKAEKLEPEENHGGISFEPRRAQVAPRDKKEPTRKGLEEQGSLEEEEEEPAIPVLVILWHKQNSVGKKHLSSPSISFPPALGLNFSPALSEVYAGHSCQ